jgi:hypothetical protein
VENKGWHGFLKGKFNARWIARKAHKNKDKKLLIKLYQFVDRKVLLSYNKH